MNIELVTILFFATFVVLLLTGLPLAWVMGSTSVIFALILFNPDVMVMMVIRVYDLILSYSLVAAPMFILMGNILQKSGISEELFRAIHVWSGRIRGGLASATIISCAVMAALVGVIGAEIATFGLIALPAMFNRGYSKTFALGSVAAGGGLASLIPPSIVFIFYGMICNVSIGKLYIAGIVPGILLAIIFIGYILIRAAINPDLAPAAPESEREIPLKEKFFLLKGLILPFILVVAVLGSIYAGVATPTEAGGIGVLGSILCAVFKKKLKINDLKLSMYSTVEVTCMLIWLLFGSQTIIGIYTLAGGDQFVKTALMSLPYGRWGILIVMQIIFIFLGCIMDWIGILMLTMPLFLPILKDLNFDLLWFGVVFCMNMQISYISPPFGPACFYLKAVAPEGNTVEDIYKSIWPFLILTIGTLILIIIFPQISLWLPNKMAK